MTSTALCNVSDGVLGLSLEDEPCPAFVVDAAASAFLVINVTGRTLLGLERDVLLPYPLDSAMPALARLRQLARNTPAPRTHERLTFWCNGRLHALECEVNTLANGNGGPLFSIICTTAKTGIATKTEPEAGGNGGTAADHPGHDRLDQLQTPAAHPAAHNDSPPRVPRDDTETLKEIARRIREGYEEAPPVAIAPADPVRPQASEPWLWDTPAPTPITPLARTLPTPLQPRPIPRTLAPGELSKLAHELKTPLTAIAAASEIMRDERLGRMGNVKYLGYAADIHDSATHALAVIATMLTTPAEADDASMVASDIDLNDLVARTLSTMQPLATERGLTLAFDPEEAAPVVTANATAVRQILLNLLTNALKFTPPGGDVRAVTGYLADGSVFMVVRDTGAGIDDAALDSANGEDETPEPAHLSGGQGIGLPLVRRLAAGMGAEIEFDSAPGKGTAVLMAFPKA